MADITTNDIMDTLQELMQMTVDGFTRLESKMDSLESRTHKLEKQYDKLTELVNSIASEQKAQTNDISEILDRLLVIEKRLPNITESELKEMQTKLQALIDWAIQSAKANNIPLNLPKNIGN